MLFTICAVAWLALGYLAVHIALRNGAPVEVLPITICTLCGPLGLVFVIMIVLNDYTPTGDFERFVKALFLVKDKT